MAAILASLHRAHPSYLPIKETSLSLSCLSWVAKWVWVHVLGLRGFSCMQLSSFAKTMFMLIFYPCVNLVFVKYFAQLVLCVFFFSPLQWSWPWSWTACTVEFATLASTQTLSWSTLREQGGSPSLISRVTLLLSALALYSCSMEKSINGWAGRKEWAQCLSASSFGPLLSSIVSPHLTSCSVSLRWL